MRLTLDWNCVIEVEDSGPHAAAVLELVGRHRLGQIEVALLAASASENNRCRRFPGSAEHFKKRVGQLGWADLPLVPMPGVYGLSYWSFAYWVDDGAAFENLFGALWAVIAPNVQRELTDYLPIDRQFDDRGAIKFLEEAIQTPQLSRWRNTWCDVMSAYCHIHEHRDVFVTNNTRDFQAKTRELRQLGMTRIATPTDAIEYVKTLG